MPARRRRWFLLGDPQTTFARVLALLDRHRLLDGERLRPDVGLVSLGDHFDFHGDPTAVGLEGERVLAWLASHAPEQAVILAGNHDLARVMELALIDDAAFAEARALALEDPAAQGFSARHGELPAPGVLARDYHSFAVSQRARVAALLRAGRMRLAARAVREDGTELLLTHAGVTARELALLGAPRGAVEIAASLNDALDRALSVWREGEALSLAPLHHAGAYGGEGGGLLYHRPAHRGEGDDDAWDAARPRRFDPRALPAGVAQACGHTGHAKCRALLWASMTDEARRVARGGLRTLSVRGGEVRYAMGLEAHAEGAATLYLLDADLSRGVEDATLMQVAEVHAG